MNAPLAALLARFAQEDLDATEAQALFGALLDGPTTQAQFGAFLALSVRALRQPEFLTAGARAMRARMRGVAAPAGAIDVCGTGGDGSHTVNVSTAVSFVVAGCGVPVAKHGNRAASSRSGAADVLSALGVSLETDPARAFAEAGIAFLFAPNHHPALAPLGPIRRELGFRTVFNLLGPLANPAGVRRQLVGVASPGLMSPIADAFAGLESDHVWVLHGAGGVDEISPSGPTDIIIVDRGVRREMRLEPEELGFALFPPEALRGGEPAENARALRAVLAGEDRGAYRVATVLNAAAALVVAGRAADLPQAVSMAEAAIDSGAAALVLSRLIGLAP